MIISEWESCRCESEVISCSNLSVESVVRIVPLLTFNKTGQAVFLCQMAKVKEVVWWTWLKGLRSDILFFGQILIDFLKFPLEGKVRVEREVLPLNEFIERWVTVIKMVWVNGPKVKMVWVNGFKSNRGLVYFLDLWGSLIGPSWSFSYIRRTISSC